MTAGGDAVELGEKIANRSRSECLHYVVALSDSERRTLRADALRLFEEIDRQRYSVGAERSLPGRNSLEAQLENARIAVICTATLSELKKLGWRVLPGDGFIVPLVEALQPEWIDDWIEALADGEPGTFPFARQLLSAGLCRKPRSDGYILGMITVMPLPGGRAGGLWREDQALADRIRAAPDILNEDIWRLFEVEGGGELSLAATDKYLGKWGKWSVALKELSEEGLVSRDRLLDETLRALLKDFAQFRAGWFSRFHEELKPTPTERNERRAQYLALLGSSIPPTVSFALKALTITDKSGKLPSAEILDHISPVLRARAKGTVKSALRLLASAAKRDASLAAEASIVAVDALIHEAADVQSAALDLVDTLGDTGDPRLRDKLAGFATDIAPSLRARLEALAAISPDAVVADASTDTDADTDEPGNAAPEPRAVAPIESFEETLHSLLELLEDPSDPLAVERTLDGLCRFGAAADRESDVLLGPVGKRATAIVARESNDSIRFHLARLAKCYVDDEALPPVGVAPTLTIPAGPSGQSIRLGSPGFETVFADRNAWILSVIRDGKSWELLSAPTDTRGFVDATELIGRLGRLGAQHVAPNDYDLALALMRLSPDDRPEGRELAGEAASRSDETLAALAFALGQDVDRGPTDWLWLAAAAARLPRTDPARDDPIAGALVRFRLAFERRDPFTFLRLNVEPRIDQDVPTNHLARLFGVPTLGLNFGGVCGHHVNSIRWCSLVWPLNLEPFFAQGVAVLDHSQRLANTPYAGFFEPLLEPHVRIGDMGSALLALGLAASDPAVKGLALEAAIVTIGDGRLDPAMFRNALAELLPSGYVPVGRWTKSFSELSAVSAAHAAFVSGTIAGALRHDPAAPPRDLGGLVELLYELQVALGTALSDREAIRYLSNVKAGGKLGRFAKKLLEL